MYAVTGYSNQYGDLWRWNILATNEDIEAVYGALYSVINRCNFLLDYIPGVQQSTIDDDALDKLDMIHGEALFARALCYSCLLYTSHMAKLASLGILQSPLGLMEMLPTLGPSGRHERLNC